MPNSSIDLEIKILCSTLSVVKQELEAFEMKFVSDIGLYQLNVLSFFFQAEDGIRYRDVTGVQTCALPICRAFSRLKKFARRVPPVRPLRSSLELQGVH